MIDVIGRIGVPVPYDGALSMYAPFVALLRTTPAGFDSYYAQWTKEGLNGTKIDVVSVGVVSDGQVDLYTQYTSLEDCIAQESSFYFSIDEQLLYIHYDHDVFPQSVPLLIGQTFGISRDAVHYIDNIEFVPTITAFPQSNKRVDPIDNDKMSFQVSKLSLFNGDGRVDSFLRNPLSGALVTLWFYDSEDQSETVFYTGVVTAINTTIDQITFTLEDPRAQQTITIPTTKVNRTDYPSAAKESVGKYIPEGYGDVDESPCVCVNALDTGANKIYKFATDATSVSEVWAEKNNVWTQVTPVSTDPVNGEITVLNADAVRSGSSVNKVRVVARLRDIGNPGDIIADMNLRYNNRVFDSANYNVTEWTAEAAKLAPVGFVMEKTADFLEWVGELQGKTDLPFIYGIENDGKFTLRVNDPDRPIARFIKREEMKGDLLPTEQDYDQYASSVSVLYAKNLRTELSEEEEYNAEQNLIIQLYGRPLLLSFDTWLITAADAKRRADVIGIDYGRVRQEMIVQLHLIDPGNADLKVFDFVEIDSRAIDRSYVEYLDFPEILIDGSSGDELLIDGSSGDELLIDNGVVIVPDVDRREYWGVFKAQVLGIRYLAEDLTYQLTVREREVS